MECCTIVCAVRDFQQGLSGLPAILPAGAEQVVTEDHVEIRTERSSIRFSPLLRVKPGDQFSKLTLSMHNYFNRIRSADPRRKRHVLDAISKAALYVGVVASPKFLEDDRHSDIIFTLAGSLNGLVFTGDAMLNAHGDIILSAAGDSEAP
jgi:hypothetical protein